MPGQRPPIDEPPTIKIISIGPYFSGYDSFEGDYRSMYVNTNMNFDTVDWYVNDSFVWTSDGPNKTSVFSHDYPDLGSTTGAAVVVKAVATDADGNTDTDQATINVWTKSETVAITSQTNDQDYIDAAISNIAVQTDVGFYRVDWSIDGGSPISDNGPDLESQIMYDFSTVPHGKTVTFTATPYGVNADGEAVAGEAATIKITAWKTIRIDFDYQTRCVEGESIRLSAYTTVPFTRVEYTVNGKTVEPDYSDGPLDTFSQTSYLLDLRDEEGSREGSTYSTTAVAFAMVAGEEISSEKDIGQITVYADRGYIWKTTTASIDSIDATNMNEHEYILRTEHTVSYYNDTGEVQEQDIKTSLAWAEGLEPDKMGGWEGVEDFHDAQEERVFYGQADIPLQYLPRTLTPGRWYSVAAYTNLVSDQNAQVSVDSGDGVQYDLDMNLPPTGQYGYKDNKSNEAKFLFE